jgi:drug/metabolite transporter (DMT)-like permease
MHTNKFAIDRTDSSYLYIIGIYLLLLILGFIWGIQFLVNEIALKTLPAMTTATLRAMAGAFAVSILSIMFSRAPKNVTQDRKPIWYKYVIISIFDVVIPFYLMNLGQQHVNSGIASIVLSTAPIFVLFLSGLFLSGRHWNLSMAISVITGFCGIVILMLPSSHADSSTIGELSLLGASLSFAIAVILLKTLPPENQIKSIRNILVSASIIMIIPTCIIDKPWTLTYSTTAILCISFLGIVCSGLAYLIYIKLVHLVSPTFASLCGYLTPVVGVLLGFIYEREIISTHELVALIVVFASVFISQLPQLIYKKLQKNSLP